VSYPTEADRESNLDSGVLLSRLRSYIAYGNQYRHAAQQNRPRPQLSEPVVESFVCLSDLESNYKDLDSRHEDLESRHEELSGKVEDQEGELAVADSRIDDLESEDR
jgi:hypothetical protein